MNAVSPLPPPLPWPAPGWGRLFLIYARAVTEFRPGLPLPDTEQATVQGQLYHAPQRGDWATMRREGYVWAWRTLRGEDKSTASGSWADMQTWLSL